MAGVAVPPCGGRLLRPGGARRGLAVRCERVACVAARRRGACGRRRQAGVAHRRLRVRGAYRRVQGVAALVSPPVRRAAAARQVGLRPRQHLLRQRSRRSDAALPLRARVHCLLQCQVLPRPLAAAPPAAALNAARSRAGRCARAWRRQEGQGERSRGARPSALPGGAAWRGQGARLAVRGHHLTRRDRAGARAAQAAARAPERPTALAAPCGRGRRILLPGGRARRHLALHGRIARQRAAAARQDVRAAVQRRALSRARPHGPLPLTRRSSHLTP
mmetsp:Transcript_23821/g.48395  ORF Transcript_23821/g.48395 Transcript_23821/m.48395 type:complete len:276 (-) Transcript_23821:26-853(-)